MKLLLRSLPAVTWIVALSCGVLVRTLLRHASETVLVPLVSLPKHSQGDIVSDVTGLVIVIGWALVSLLIVEPTKALAARSEVSHRYAFPALVLYQIILFGDTIRAHAFDWWKWMLSLVGATTLTPANEMHEVAGFHFPWISLCAAVAATVLVFQPPLPPRPASAVRADVRTHPRNSSQFG